MLVREWMTTVLVTVRPDAPVAEAQHLMRHRHIRHLPVVEGGRLAGIITETDLLRAFATILAAEAPTPARVAAATAPRSSPSPREARHTILVPLDGSPGSESVLATVGELALARGAHVRLLRVASEPKALEADNRIISYADQETSRVELETLAYLRRVALTLPGIEVDCTVGFGEAAEEIVKTAQATRVHLIAMATHRRRGLDRTLRGSVAETVERSSAIPVMMVPYGPEPAG